MVIVGIGYKARHGKDTLAKYLIQGLYQKGKEIDVRRYSFATALKCYCRVQGWMTVKDGKVLQYVGTELFRDRVNPDYWVQMVDYQIQEEQPDIAIFSDMRFPNEKAFVEKHGISVKVERINDDGSLYAVNDGRAVNHASEISLDGHEFNYNFKVKNGELNQLKIYADYLVDKILGNL